MKMPKAKKDNAGKDQYQALDGYDDLTWMDHLKASVTSDLLRTNPKTGAVENPRREYLKERIRARQATKAAREAANSPKKK
jgi:hypothetical protein